MYDELIDIFKNGGFKKLIMKQVDLPNSILYIEELRQARNPSSILTRPN
jgi:hypothetical protein